MPNCVEPSLDADLGGRPLARALRNHNVWLALTYVGLILLLARTYA